MNVSFFLLSFVIPVLGNSFCVYGFGSVVVIGVCFVNKGQLDLKGLRYVWQKFRLIFGTFIGTLNNWLHCRLKGGVTILYFFVNIKDPKLLWSFFCLQIFHHPGLIELQRKQFNLLLFHSIVSPLLLLLTQELIYAF